MSLSETDVCQQRFLWHLLILHHQSVKSKIPPYFKDQSVPLIPYAYTIPIASTIFNYKHVLHDPNLDDFLYRLELKTQWVYEHSLYVNLYRIKCCFTCLSFMANMLLSPPTRPLTILFLCVNHIT